MSDLELPVETLRDQINGAIDIIIQLERDSSGVRRVRQIDQVTSQHREAYATSPLLRYESQDATGTFRAFPIDGVVRERLMRAGETLPSGYGEVRS